MATTFKHDSAEGLFIVDVDGRQGTIVYQVAGPDVLEFQSTYIPGSLRKNGIGTQLVRYALEWVRDHRFKVIPTCWFVREVMDRDEEYRKLKA